MKGFTIIEVMIALFILLVGITGVIRIQIAGASVASLSNSVTVAQNIAQSMLQRELSRGTTALISTGVCGNQTGLIPTSNPFNYTINCTVRTNTIPVIGSVNIPIGAGTTSTDKTNAASVVVAVSWSDTLGETHQVFSVGMSTQQ
jgi:prepilin-type N-terminal cleavage/methylation domain-containing protein